jgi:hypothetical protein
MFPTNSSNIAQAGNPPASGWREPMNLCAIAGIRICTTRGRWTAFVLLDFISQELDHWANLD